MLIKTDKKIKKTFKNRVHYKNMSIFVRKNIKNGRTKI